MVTVINLSLKAGLLKSFILHFKKLCETLLTYYRNRRKLNTQTQQVGVLVPWKGVPKFQYKHGGFQGRQRSMFELRVCNIM
jgi:hypothetical protein